MRKINISLLCRWWWKLRNEEGFGKLEDKCVNQISYRATNSLVWNGLIKINHVYLKGRIMRHGNEEYIYFWHDVWCGTIPLKERFHELLRICFNQDCTVNVLVWISSSATGEGLL
jgi:hypothetical protein